MAFTGSTNAASLVNVMRSHSSANAAEVRRGFHASRPNACQLAHAKTAPHQVRLVPVLATPAAPCSSSRTAGPLPPLARVSALKTSSKSGARYTRWVANPRYSFVICSSIVSGVRGRAPKSGWNGSRGWKSMGPFLICSTTLERNRPSSGVNSLKACFARSSPSLSE